MVVGQGLLKWSGDASGGWGHWPQTLSVEVPGRSGLTQKEAIGCDEPENDWLWDIPVD